MRQYIQQAEQRLETLHQRFLAWQEEHRDQYRSESPTDPEER